MKIWFFLTFIYFIVISFEANANITIAQTDIACSGSNECAERVQKLKDLNRSFPSFDHLKTLLKLYMKDESVGFFNYELIEKNAGGYLLKGNLILNKRVVDIDLEEVEELVPLSTVHALRYEGFYDERKEKKMINNLTTLIRGRGYPHALVTTAKTETNEGINIKFMVNKGRPKLLKRVKLISDNQFLSNLIYRKLNDLMNKPFDLALFKTYISELQDLFVSYDYYALDFKYKSNNIENNDVEVVIELKDADLYSFSLEGNKFFDIKTLKDQLKDMMVALKRVHDAESIKAIVRDLYLEKGFKDVAVKVNTQKYKDHQGVATTNLKISIQEGQRYKIADVSFKGNDFYTDNQLRNMFFELGDNDIFHRYHNEEYYENFVSILKSKYLENGFVNILIEKPQVNFLKDTKEITIDYRLREVVRSQIAEIEIIGVPNEIKKEILSRIVNKEKKYFNPLLFEEDLKTILSYLRNSGYYYATIKSVNANDLVKYNQDNSVVRLKIEIDLDKKYIINDLIIIGNYRTRSKLIERESGFAADEYLTENMMRNAQSNLLALGLFSRVSIRPVKMGEQVDLFIDIEEKDFGLIELAPGFRTDVGLKISSKISYINIDGMNKQVGLNAIVNRRFDLQTLDERRREEGHQLIEYEANINYSENKIFDWPLDYSASFSTLRRRFYSFDADIDRLNNTILRNFNNWFSVSVKHQFETISQYDATLEREHGDFQIGSLTPGVTFDFRDNRINPQRGAYFNLTCEFANPYFGSQRKDSISDDFEINYYKLISRNRFYIPMGEVTLAISTSLGVQKNLSQQADNENEAASGYIPNIKVFRLTGVDLVRGFEDSEINRLVTGEDISEVRVDDTAYMANLKIEPRVFISDSMMVGVFYDAGRVFVDSYDFGELRSSAGLTFKYLTPVGSLDFDYGIKLLRNRDSDGRLESPGRLHVSIGFF